MTFDSIIFIVLHLSNNLRSFESIQPIESKGIEIPYEIIGLLIVVAMILIGGSYKMLKDRSFN